MLHVLVFRKQHLNAAAVLTAGLHVDNTFLIDLEMFVFKMIEETGVHTVEALARSQIDTEEKRRFVTPCGADIEPDILDRLNLVGVLAFQVDDLIDAVPIVAFAGPERLPETGLVDLCQGQHPARAVFHHDDRPDRPGLEEFSNGDFQGSSLFLQHTMSLLVIEYCYYYTL